MELDETTTGARRIYEGKVLNLRVDTVTLPNGRTAEREIVEHRGAVAIVPVRDNGDVVLVRQFRHPANKPLLEIPAGTRDGDEDPDTTAHRELAEEINASAGRMVKLFEAYMAPGYSTELIHFYAAFDLSATEGKTDEDEFLLVEHVSLEDAIKKIHTGEICDAKSISALLFVQQQWAQLTAEQPS